MNLKTLFSVTSVGMLLLVGAIWAQQPQAESDFIDPAGVEIDEPRGEFDEAGGEAAPPPVEPRRERFEQKLITIERRREALTREMYQLLEQGRKDEARRLVQEIQELKTLQHQLKSHAHDDDHEQAEYGWAAEGFLNGEEGEFERVHHQVEHLHQAAEHLEAAGRHENAEQLRNEAHELELELNRELERREARERGHRGEHLAELTEMMHVLHKEVRALREEVQSLRRIIQHQKAGEADSTKEFDPDAGRNKTGEPVEEIEQGQAEDFGPAVKPEEVEEGGFLFRP